MPDKVFVYGTLMKGHINHDYYLAHAEFLGQGEIEGYALYEVSYYPGIVPESGEKVKGEVYRIDEETLSRLDDLEDEGSLYIRKKVKVLLNGEYVEAWTYIWNRGVTGKIKVAYEDQPWKWKYSSGSHDGDIKRYVWYACYGSNMLKERFLYYVQGGVCRFNGARYNGCTD